MVSMATNKTPLNIDTIRHVLSTSHVRTIFDRVSHSNKCLLGQHDVVLHLRQILFQKFPPLDNRPRRGHKKWKTAMHVKILSLSLSLLLIKKALSIEVENVKDE